MSDLVEMYRKALQEESKVLGTPNSCTINRAMELVFSAYNLGKAELEEQHLRERYAGMAMQAFITNGFSEDSLSKNPNEARHQLAKDCIKMADVLIEELSKKE